MIVLAHNSKKVTSVFNLKTKEEIAIHGKLNVVFFELAAKYPNKRIVWSNEALVPFINRTTVEKLANFSISMFSFETSEKHFINSSIGFVDQTLFVHVPKDVEYPTWFMSSDIGVISSEILNKFKNLLKYKLSFEEVLNYIAKKGMNNGLLCKSLPLLLINNYPIISKKQISKARLLRFIKSNYKYRWVWLYQLNQLVYRNELIFFSFLKSIFKQRIDVELTVEHLKLEKKPKIQPTIDVLIPTLGREQYLKDVLLDLSKQTLKPTRVIIVEQQTIENSSSTLDFLREDWPFEIDHTLIYQLGACNARNIALTKVKSGWVFFADDDIRMEADFLEQSFQYIQAHQAKAVTLSCLQKGEFNTINKVVQWGSFGSGCSIIKGEYLKNIKFDMAYEFGYGEDFDFGMQLRKKGIDILYIPFVKMLHLKAPIGGFRKKNTKEWEKENVLPKPSPTVMVVKLKHSFKEQIQGYKTNLFIKFYKNQTIKNPFKYYNYFKTAWSNSKLWAIKLMEENEI